MTKKLVLTFDDGPDSIYTNQLLDLLKSQKIKATFFLVAKNALKLPGLVKRIKNEGHCIALHSLEHRHALLCGYRYFSLDFSNSMDIFRDLKCDIKYYRPPWGARNLFTKYLVKRHGLIMVLWDVMVQDWKRHSSSQEIADKIENRIFDGAILCLHDGCEKYGGEKMVTPQMIEALKLVLPKLKNEGWQFITVEEYFDNA
ncbi:MAG: polysaccharide deacetylase family protein [Anaerolineaceae bacterium]|nr:MAG: polysaccharide deacetylase family protein [Anaerolineaceae bacterium]